MNEIDRYPLLAAAIKEVTMTAFGVMPPHPFPVYCGARDDDTGRICDLDAGHDGPHQSIITITWTDEDAP